MTTARERALERMLSFQPALISPGAVVEELIAAYTVAEIGRDLVTEYKLGAGVSWEKLQAAIDALDARRSS